MSFAMTLLVTLLNSPPWETPAYAQDPSDPSSSGRVSGSLSCSEIIAHRVLNYSGTSPVRQRLSQLSAGTQIRFRNLEDPGTEVTMTVADPQFHSDPGGREYLLGRTPENQGVTIWLDQIDVSTVRISHPIPAPPKPQIAERFKIDFPRNYEIFSQSRNPPGEEGYHLWTVPAQGKPQDSAALAFSVDKAEREIVIEMTVGSTELKGAASYLAVRMAEAHPGYTIKAQLVATNADSLIAAFRDAITAGRSLAQADFSRVPSLRALNVPFELNVRWYEGKPYFFVAQYAPAQLTLGGDKRILKNPKDIQNDQRLLEWIKSLPANPQEPPATRKRKYTLDEVSRQFEKYRRVQLFPP
ncbi:MAG: hypothetical protein ACK5QT_04875 [Oligoflexia bacterium]